MGSIFPDVPDEDDVAESFEELWRSLADRDREKYEYLRGHQLKILETLAKKLEDSSEKDFAISLPTGTGKTVIGLLLSYYLIRKEHLTALYLCSNIHLCNQVLKDSKEIGVPAVPLFGKWVDIPAEDKSNFISGSSVGIATYNTLFNSNPHVGNVGIIVMDDVHAAGDAIMSNWAIKIEKDANPEIFEQVYEVIRPNLNKSQINAVEARPTVDEQFEMLYSRQWLNVIDDLEPILDSHSNESSIKFQWKTVNNKLENFFCILHRNAIEIRPLTPPTHTVSEFNKSKYRFYMSATLDETGNLENNVGIETLEWIALNDVDVPGSRLILNLNSLMPNTTDESRVIFIAQKISRSIVLAPSLIHQSILKEALKRVGYKGTIFSPRSESISDDLEKFKKAPKAVLLLAGRYDGIDLGDGTADGIIIYHLPQAINSFENFTSQKWATKDESEARAIQRIHQGMGRCTRRDSDEVQIFLIGEDLVKLLLNPQTISAFPGKIRKELQMCSSMNDPKSLESFLGSFREKSTDWKESRDQVTKSAAKLSLGPNSNASKNFLFSKYSNFLWTGNYTAAQSLATGLMQKLNTDRKEKDSAVWAYLGGVASDISALISGKNPFLEPGNDLFSTAVSRANNREWFGTLSNYLQEDSIQPSMESKVENIFSALGKFSPEQNNFEVHIDDLIKKLRSGEDKDIKQFLQEFGTLLGYETSVPSRQGSPDCIWSSNGNAAFIFEAKTNKTNDFLAIDEVRQIISMPDEVKNNERLRVESSLLPICITNVRKIAKEEMGLAQKFYVLKTAELEKLAIKWLQRLLSIQKRAFRDENFLKYQIQQALITQRLTEQHLQSALCKVKGNDVLKTQ